MLILFFSERRPELLFTNFITETRRRASHRQIPASQDNRKRKFRQSQTREAHTHRERGKLGRFKNGLTCLEKTAVSDVTLPQLLFAKKLKVILGGKKVWHLKTQRTCILVRAKKGYVRCFCFSFLLHEQTCSILVLVCFYSSVSYYKMSRK